MEVGYNEAWDLWWQGKDIAEFFLWDWQIRNWGRFGKVLEFIAAIAVVVNYLGKEFLGKCGKWLWSTLDRNFLHLGSVVKVLRREPSVELEDLVYTAKWTVRLAALVAALVVLVIIWDPLIFSAVLIQFTILALLVPALLLAGLLQVPFIEVAAKWLSLTLVVVGFHFSLLGS